MDLRQCATFYADGMLFPLITLYLLQYIVSLSPVIESYDPRPCNSKLATHYFQFRSNGHIAFA